MGLGKASQNAEVVHPTHAHSGWTEPGSAHILGPGGVVYLLSWGKMGLLPYVGALPRWVLSPALPELYKP